MLGENNLTFIAGYTMVYFFKDIIPLLILGNYLSKNYVHPINIVAENTKESFIERYGVSKRETEIIKIVIILIIYDMFHDLIRIFTDNTN